MLDKDGTQSIDLNDSRGGQIVVQLQSESQIMTVTLSAVQGPSPHMQVIGQALTGSASR